MAAAGPHDTMATGGIRQGYLGEGRQPLARAATMASALAGTICTPTTSLTLSINPSLSSEEGCRDTGQKR